MVDIDEDALEEEANQVEAALMDPKTSAAVISKLGRTHMECEEQCQLCEYLREGSGISILDDVAGHINCPDGLLDDICSWAFDVGSNRIIDILLQAVKRPNLPENWLNFALDLAWRYQVQFEHDLVYHFIRNIQQGRTLTDEEKARIVYSNDLESFPSKVELTEKGFSEL